MAAVERRTLLHLLQQRAIEAGVDVRFATEADPDELLAAGYDLVVAADGANSRLRDRFADVFDSGVETATAKFIWLGTTYAFDGLTFVHERGPHGVFAVHGYPIGNGVSTFIVETGEDAWRGAGLDEFDVAVPPGPSDEKSRAYLQDLFAGQIDGHPLLVNNSRWGNFRTWRTRSWSAGRVALLGDAAHTAHFSVGSGTKMAMEDAVVLAGALDENPSDVDAALRSYEAIRQPQVAKIQDAARPSLSWWEHFGRYHDAFEPWQFAYHFLTRALTDDKLRRRDARFVADTRRRWRAGHGAEPMTSPLLLGSQVEPVRTVVVDRTGTGAVARLDHGDLPLLTQAPPHGRWGLWLAAPPDEAGLPDAIARLRSHPSTGASLVAVQGGGALPRRLLAEEARLGQGAITMLVADDDAETPWVETALLSGRADLVAAAEPTVRRWRGETEVSRGDADQ
jgi:anthraniloyl-CoA monooxygenase